MYAVFRGIVCVADVRDERNPIAEPKCRIRIEDSDNVQILIVICWRMCAIQPCVDWMQWFKGLSNTTVLFSQYVVYVDVQLCICWNTGIASSHSRWLTVWAAWKDRGILIWFGSTLLPQTEIFTVWMHRNVCVYTLLVLQCIRTIQCNMGRRVMGLVYLCLRMLQFTVNACGAIDSIGNSAREMTRGTRMRRIERCDATPISGFICTKTSFYIWQREKYWLDEKRKALQNVHYQPVRLCRRIFSLFFPS